MTDKIQTLNTLKAKPADNWADALAKLAQTHPITSIETRISVDAIVESFPNVKHFEEETVHTSGYSTRNLKLLDGHKNVVYVCQNVELDNGKLYVRESFRGNRTSWYNYIFSRFRRAPNVNINIRR
jgi:hypothetical protein